MTDIIIHIISATVAVVCIVVLLYHHHRTKRLTERLARVLDEAIAGTFNETTYDESRLSQIETKLGIVEGVGIGLYLAREIVAIQDGYIKVASALGQGSLFSVFLPKA